MLSLIYKDFLLQRGSKSFIYMIIMPIAAAFALSSEMLYVILPYIAGSYLYIVYANALDDKYKAEKMLLSMPVGRSTIVGAKYAGMMCYMLAFLAIITLLRPFIGLLPGFEAPAPLSWPKITQIITIAAMYYSIFFPLYFHLGYLKSRWVNYLAMLFSAGLYAAATKGLSAVSGMDIPSLQAALEYLSGLSSGYWNIILPLFSAVLVASSLWLSTTSYTRREL